jgi:hypothetical protein
MRRIRWKQVSGSIDGQPKPFVICRFSQEGNEVTVRAQRPMIPGRNNSAVLSRVARVNVAVKSRPYLMTPVDRPGM